MRYYLFQFTPLCEGRQSSWKGCQSQSNFNSRPCVRGDPQCSTNSPSTKSFQFTPLCEGRPSRVSERYCFLRFQFTPLCEGRPSIPGISSLQSLFQFTPLCEGRQGKTAYARGAKLFQFTPLCEGRLAPDWLLIYELSISIHAPV